LGLLYAEQGKLDEAEMMDKRALQGYEKALGRVNVARHRPALNTMWNLGYLFAIQGKLSEAKENYSRALAGFQALLGPSCKECQRLERNLASLYPKGKTTRFITSFLKISANTCWKIRATAQTFGWE
jgi:hypothetical protein